MINKNLGINSKTGVLERGKFLNFMDIKDFIYYNDTNILPPPLEKVQMGECL